MRIIFATHNPDKMEEIREIMSDMTSEVLMKSDFGLTEEPEENGRSFQENAEIKAAATWREMKKKELLRIGDVILADDSGFCVDYLHGAPGIYSSRFMGEDTPYSEKNAALLERLKHAEGKERSAHYTCHICAALFDGELIHTEAYFHGALAYAPRGEHGFGYDPIFYVEEYDKTAAEMDLAFKNSISHRGKALREMRRILLERREEIESGERGNTEECKKRILVVSDTHRADEGTLTLLKEGKWDMMIHLGDGEGSADKFRQAAGENCACVFLRGNNDYGEDLPMELTLRIGKTKCFLTHGHSYFVNANPIVLAEEAHIRGCQIAMFGHTHKPYRKNVEGVLCLNPGSISYPRQEGHHRSYMILTVDEEGEMSVEQKYL